MSDRMSIPVSTPPMNQLITYDIGPNLMKLLGPFLTSSLTLISRLEITLSKLSDSVDAVTTSVATLSKSIDDAVARDVALVADLNAKITAANATIADLQAQLAAGAGSLSQAEEDALGDKITALTATVAELQAKVDGMDVTSPTTITPAPVPTP
jgi:uncharacterized coiled-coil protein SlyX